MVLDSLRHFSDLTHILFWAVKRTYCTPHGAPQATNAGEARGIFRLLQTSSPQATDKPRSILAMGILEVAVVLLVTLPLMFRPRLSQRFL
jgi:hypothetical protein